MKLIAINSENDGGKEWLNASVQFIDLYGSASQTY